LPLGVAPLIKLLLEGEQPRSVLEISGYDNSCGEAIYYCMQNIYSKKESGQSYKIDRVDLSDGQSALQGSVYNNVFISDVLMGIDDMDTYDVIMIFHLFENMHAEDALILLKKLLTRTSMQVLIVTPIYPYDLNTENELSDIRVYHPILFFGMDFCYMMINTSIGKLQAYSFYPTKMYEKLPCDALPQLCDDTFDAKRKLRIAFILPYQHLTGGMKALYQQMKELNDCGHRIFAYYRSDTAVRAIPEWSHLTDDDISGQFVISEDEYYLDNIKNVDIIVLGFVNQVAEFKYSKIPVALWEQGYPELYGDNGMLLCSNDKRRKITHELYRAPIHILAVSKVVQDILAGIYNRESQFFTNGIDTEFYFPAQQKYNEIPIVLIVGNPDVRFKNFDFTLTVLEATCLFGTKFKVQWATPVEYTCGEWPFEIEMYVQPSQEELVQLYRNADVFLTTTLHETFSLPPLEAMASGTAVVSTNNGGIMTYAKPGVNCVLCEQGDLITLSFALQQLLTDPQLRNKLAVEGRKTALEFSFKQIVSELEKCLYRILLSYSNNANP